jgi:hypothetical protein
MNGSHSQGRASRILVFLLAVFGLAGAAVDKAALPQEAVTLAYKFTAGTPLSYKQIGTQVQNIDVMGQIMVTEISTSLDITLLPKGLKDGNHLLGVTIDGLTINVQGPQGGLTPDLKDIIGKSFDFVLSPRGEEVDVSGASAFYVDTGQGGRRDLSSDFQGLFPNLPDHPVKVGDKWPSEETITQKSDAGDIRIVFKNENTLDGLETVDGRACARIKTAVNGVMSGALTQSGMSLALNANLAGTETSYFGLKDGVFVKSEMAADMNGGIAVEAMGTTIPFTGQQRNTMALVKK